MEGDRIMVHYVFYRDDGTLNALVNTEDKLDLSAYDASGFEVEENIAKLVEADIESYIVEHPMDVANAHIRKRTGIEMETRVGKSMGE